MRVASARANKKELKIGKDNIRYTERVAEAHLFTSCKRPARTRRGMQSGTSGAQQTKKNHPFTYGTNHAVCYGYTSANAVTSSVSLPRRTISRTHEIHEARLIVFISISGSAAPALPLRAVAPSRPRRSSFSSFPFQLLRVNKSLLRDWFVISFSSRAKPLCACLFTHLGESAPGARAKLEANAETKEIRIHLEYKYIFLITISDC